MCTGDQSLPGGLTALIKQEERERGRGSGRGDKEGGVHELKDGKKKWEEHARAGGDRLWRRRLFGLFPWPRVETLWRWRFFNGRVGSSLLSCQEEAINTISTVYSTFQPARRSFHLVSKRWRMLWGPRCVLALPFLSCTYKLNFEKRG